MAIPCRPEWSTLARQSMPAVRAAEAREHAKRRAASERAREAASWWRAKAKPQSPAS